MALGLLNQDIAPVRGNAALLPNQPILHTCRVASTEETILLAGDVVALAEGDGDDVVVVKRAEVTDFPLGVVVGNAIKTGFGKGEHISIFPDNSYVYMTAGGAITRGSALQFNATGNVLATETSDNGYIGIALTTAQEGELVIVQVKPSI